MKNLLRILMILSCGLCAASIAEAGGDLGPWTSINHSYDLSAGTISGTSNNWDITHEVINTNDTVSSLRYIVTTGNILKVANETSALISINPGDYIGLEALLTYDNGNLWGDTLSAASNFTKISYYEDIVGTSYNRAIMLVQATALITPLVASNTAILSFSHVYNNAGDPYSFTVSDAVGMNDPNIVDGSGTAPHYNEFQVARGTGTLGGPESAPEPATVVGLGLMVLAAGLRRMRKV